MPRFTTALSSVARIWVPNSRSQQLTDIRRLWVRNFGGLTEYQAWGSYTNANGDVIAEPVAVLEAYYDPLEVQASAVIHSAAGDLLAAGEQQVLAFFEGSAWTFA